MAAELSNSLFLHIPKTGGSTVITICKKLNIFKIEEEVPQSYYFPDGTCKKKWFPKIPIIRHPTAKEIKDFHPWYWEKIPHKFTIIRHPLAWYQSHFTWNYYGWKYTKGNELNWLYYYSVGKGFKSHPQNSQEGFDNYIKWCIDYYKKNQIGPFSEYFNQFVNYVDFIGKTENLRDDLYKILKDCNETVNKNIIYNTPSVNTRNKRKFKYPQKLAEKLMDTEKDFTKRFNYNYIEDEWII